MSSRGHLRARSHLQRRTSAVVLLLPHLNWCRRSELCTLERAAWWAAQQAARAVAAARLRSPLGGPTQTFAALEAALLRALSALKRSRAPPQGETPATAHCSCRSKACHSEAHRACERKFAWPGRCLPLLLEVQSAWLKLDATAFTCAQVTPRMLAGACSSSSSSSSRPPEEHQASHLSSTYRSTTWQTAGPQQAAGCTDACTARRSHQQRRRLWGCSSSQAAGRRCSGSCCGCRTGVPGCTPGAGSAAAGVPGGPGANPAHGFRGLPRPRAAACCRFRFPGPQPQGMSMLQQCHSTSL